jgi:hypothetical protein
MINDKYNYSLNGIEHEIILNHNLKIDQKPINKKILVSNKYILKYINDLFDINNIEYCLVGDSLLGVYIFNGINIFNSKLEICTSDINFFKIKKIEDEIKNDGFNISITEKIIKISTVFFDKIKTIIYIYPLEKDTNEDILKYKDINNKLLIHNFYDIFPVKKNIYEEFEMSIPNKIDKVLISFGYNLSFISFSNNKDDNKQIIDEIEKNKSSLTEIFNKFISIIKPFIL